MVFSVFNRFQRPTVWNTIILMRLKFQLHCACIYEDVFTFLYIFGFPYILYFFFFICFPVYKDLALTVFLLLYAISPSNLILNGHLSRIAPRGYLQVAHTLFLYGL